MGVEVEELYLHLNRLLEDICKFLKDETNYEKFSLDARKQADELISRSKKQLQDIAKIKTDIGEYDGAYVDMERKSIESNEEDKDNIYSSVEETTVVFSQPAVYTHTNPYINLPAKDLSQIIKFGYLSWKCRIIFKIEKIRRIYAGVHENWLLIYSSEKDCKPLQMFDLKFHKAQEVSSKQNKNLSQDFELICTLGEKKTYYFLALTHKDMLQWISHINRCNDNLNKSENILVIEDNIPETNVLKSQTDEEEEIYHEPYYPEVVENEPPKLPARGCFKNNMPLPLIPHKEISDDSNTGTSTHSLESNSSFSEGSEDDIYEFVTKQHTSKSHTTMLNDNNQVSNEIYTNSLSNNIKSTAEKPKLLAKPKFCLDKSRNIVISKK